MSCLLRTVPTSAALFFALLPPALAQRECLRIDRRPGEDVRVLQRPMTYAQVVGSGLARAGPGALLPTSGADLSARVFGAVPGSTSEPNAYAAESDRIALGVGIEGDMPRALALTPDGLTIVVVARDTDSLEFFDAVSGTRLGGLSVGDTPVDVELTPDGATAIVACLNGHSIDFVDIATRSLQASVSLGSGEPYRVQLTPDGSQVAVGILDGVGASQPGRFRVLDVATHSIRNGWNASGQSPIGSFSNQSIGVVGAVFADFALVARGTRLALADFHQHELRLYRLSDGLLLSTIDTGQLAPCRIDFCDERDIGVVSLMDPSYASRGALLVFDSAGSTLAQYTASNTMSLSNVRISPDASLGLIATLGGLDVIEIATGAITSLAVGSSLAPIEFTADGLYAVTSAWNTSIIELASKSVVGTTPAKYIRELVVSPLSPRAYALSYLTDETLRAISTEGAAATNLWRHPIGVPVEVDGPYAVGVSADGLRAIVTCPLSKNLALVDLEQRRLTSTVPTDGAAHGLAVSPVEEIALVLQEEHDSVAILDTALGQMLTEIHLGGTPRQILIARDGGLAIVLTLHAPGFGVAMIEVDGASSSLLAEVPLGNSYEGSLAISRDAGMVAVSEGFPGSVTLLDSATQSVLATVAVPIVPDAMAFTPDGGRLLVSSLEDQLTVITLDTGEVSAESFPFLGVAMTITIGESGAYAYITRMSLVGAGLELSFVVLDLEDYRVVQELPLTGGTDILSISRAFHALRHCNELVIASSDFGALWRVQLDGRTSRLKEQLHAGGEFSGLAVSARLGLAMLSLSEDEDQLQVAHFADEVLGTRYCAVNANSTGQVACIFAFGSACLERNNFNLRVEAVPDQPLLFFFGSNRVQWPFGNGNLCARGGVTRLRNPQLAMGHTASMRLDLPSAGIFSAGTLNFQCWYRDPAASGAAFNLSDALAVTFER